MRMQYLLGVVNLDERFLYFGSDGEEGLLYGVPFTIDPFEETLVREGGLMGYALEHYGQGGDA